MSSGDFNIQRSLRRVRVLIIGITILCLVALVVLIAFVPIDERVSANGRVRAEKDSVLYSPEDGLLAEIHADVGQNLQAGDPVLSLDATPHQERLAQLKSSIVRAEAELELEKARLETINKLPLPKEFWHVQEELTSANEKLRQAETDFDRAKILHEKGLISAQEFDRAKLNVDLARTEGHKIDEKLRVLDDGFEDSLLKEAAARLRTEMSELEELQTEKRITEDRIARATVRAPGEGVVSYLHKIRPGERVTRGEELANMAHGEPIRVDLFVGEQQIHRLRPGQSVRMQSSSFDSLRHGYIEGEIVEVPFEPEEILYVEGRPTQSTYRVKARVNSSPQPLVIGTTVNARITLRRSPIWKLLLPFDAMEDAAKAAEKSPASPEA